MKAYYFWEKDTEAKFQSSFQNLYFLLGIIWQRAKKKEFYL